MIRLFVYGSLFDYLCVPVQQMQKTIVTHMYEIGFTEYFKIDWCSRLIREVKIEVNNVSYSI